MGVSRVVKVPVLGDAPAAGAPRPARVGSLVPSYVCGSHSALAQHGAAPWWVPAVCTSWSCPSALQARSCPNSVVGRNQGAWRCRRAAVPSGCAASRVAGREFVVFKGGSSWWGCRKVVVSSTASLCT